MKAKDLAKKNYDRGLWTEDMIENLVVKGKLTSAEYEYITGSPYPENGEVSAQEALAEIMEVAQ